MRWTPFRNYHATLVFLGATPHAEVERIGAQLRAVTAGWPPIHAAAGGVSGAIRRKGSGVAWLQIGAGRQALSDLSLRLHHALQNGTDASRQTPHVTLARRVDRAVLEELGGALPEVELAWVFTRVVLYRSHTTSLGSHYEELAGTALAGDLTGGRGAD
ncbi:hypothetical protein BH24CHL6_BH24CHL6_01320 [soil metagenome]